MDNTDISHIILVFPNLDIIKQYRDKYKSNPQTRVETYTWLKECQDQGYVLFTPPSLVRMTGRIPYSQGGSVSIYFNKISTTSY